MRYPNIRVGNSLIGERRELNQDDSATLCVDNYTCRIAPSLYLEFIVARFCDKWKRCSQKRELR